MAHKHNARNRLRGAHLFRKGGGEEEGKAEKREGEEEGKNEMAGRRRQAALQVAEGTALAG